MSVEESVERRDALGDNVNRVLSSESSHRLANGEYDLVELEQDLQATEELCRSLSARRQQIQAELATLTNRVRGMGMLASADYRNICGRQSALKQELSVNIAQTGEAKARRQKLRDIMWEVTQTRPTERTSRQTSLLLDVISRLERIERRIQAIEQRSV